MTPVAGAFEAAESGRFSFSVDFLTEPVSLVPSALLRPEAGAAAGTVVRALTFMGVGVPSDDLGRAIGSRSRSRGGGTILFANCAAVSPVVVFVPTEVVDEPRAFIVELLWRTFGRGVGSSPLVLLETADGRGLGVRPKREDSLRVACALSCKAVAGVFIPAVPLTESFRLIYPCNPLVNNASGGERKSTHHVQLLLFSFKGDIKLIGSLCLGVQFLLESDEL